jgi:bacillithiol biosynthesis cysteine-adding enzyme BshC
MRLETIELEEANCFSSTFLDYINNSKKLKSFYNLPPTIESFKQQITNRNFPNERRTTLKKTLNKQYEGIDASNKTLENIESLATDNTYTIVTGHQLNIFTGPLYFIYKIVTAINTAKKLKEQYPEYNFVPVYWMATEDHDFDEINPFKLEGTKYKWETEQTGAVGRFETSTIKAILDQLPGKNQLFEKAYLEHGTLSEAVRYYVNDLFSDEGLVVIDADDQALKQSFIPVIEDDLFKHTTNNLVKETDDKLEVIGFTSQVFPRNINFFYLDGNIRGRIIKEDETYTVLDTDLTFTEDEIKSVIQSNPEKFSPNVILRPLYQEWILPNLTYIGGPSEVIYWLQLKGVFDYHKVSFPILMPRNFGLIVKHNEARKINKFDFELKDWFINAESLKKYFVNSNTAHNLSYSSQIEQLNAIYSSAKSQAGKVDVTLTQHIEALEARANKLLLKAEKKLARADKKHHQAKLEQIDAVRNVLFPNDNLQERTDNFLNFYHDNPDFIKELIEHFNPFDYKFHVLFEE